MEVFESRNELCLGLKAADEVRMVGVAGEDDLDRYLSPDRGFAGPDTPHQTRRRQFFLVACSLLLSVPQGPPSSIPLTLDPLPL